jgi:hypothetical protein
MTAYALHVGIDEVDPAVYGSRLTLRGCRADARAMRGLSEAHGWQLDAMLLNEQATRRAIRERFTHYAKTLVAGDRLLITYSGHGSSVPDKDGDEVDGRDETWVLYDGQLIDDKIGAMLEKFKPGVRVVILSDSCHSGSVTRAPGGGTPMPLAVPEIDKVKANVLLLSGCSDPEVSYDTANGGRFTLAMLDNLGKLPAGAGWRTLHAMTRKALQRVQKPQLTLSGPIDPAFVDERPFTT